MIESPKPKSDYKAGLEDVIVSLCAKAGAGKTISPLDVAKTFAAERKGDDADWHTWTGHVRRAAVGLARAGTITIYRKGKPADPDDFRGVYRLGLPRPNDQDLSRSDS